TKGHCQACRWEPASWRSVCRNVAEGATPFFPTGSGSRNMLTSACFVSLDSSHWAGLCRSLTEKASRAAAKRRLRILAGEGWIPAMSLHQFEELLAHDDERTAVARLSALRHVETLAVVNGPTDDIVPGTTVDVQRREIVVAMADPGADAETVRARVR